MKQVVLASSNAGKIQEFSQALAQLQIELLPQSEFNIPDADETGLSFVENALIKARHAAKMSGLPALADDSGLMVDALNGAPGIYSARYAGLPRDTQKNTNKLLQALSNVPHNQRQASFICVLAWVANADDPLPLIAQGQWHGDILTEPQGHSGFGYDPIFWLPTLNQSAAELSSTQKAQVSHRAQALQQLVTLLT